MDLVYSLLTVESLLSLNAAATLLPLATQVSQATLSDAATRLFRPSVENIALEATLRVEALDVYAALQTAKVLLASVEHDNEHREDDEWVITPQTNVVSVCAQNLQSSVTLVEQDVAAVERAMHTHSQKWFSSWRSTNSLAARIVTLERHKSVFDQRLRMLLDVMKALNT